MRTIFVSKTDKNVCSSRDRMRTTNNVLGDCYAAAVVEHWSQNELRAMDENAKRHSLNEDVAMLSIPMKKVSNEAV
jgi:hypothetical protein